MVLIFSQDFEPSTCHVMDWIIYYNYPYIKINVDDAIIEDVFIKLTNENSEEGFNFKVRYKGKLIELKNINSFWFRRGGLPKFHSKNNLEQLFPESIRNQFYEHLRTEIYAVYRYIYYSIQSVKRCIGDIYKSSPNKLRVLHMAKEVGLKIPETIVTINRKDILNFNKEYEYIISKGIDNIALAQDVEFGRYFSYTELISDEAINNLPETFFPSLLQKNIDKQYELRIFYLVGKFYSMAIFSQDDEQTMVDFRKYNQTKPNRCVPYQLPYEIENKLDQLMKNLELETGSIDIIVTKNNEFVFLEVNPVGQFGMVSEPCNYYLEKKIAEYLTFKSNE